MRLRSILLICSLFIITIASLASPRSFAAQQSSDVPAWLRAHAGEGEGQIAKVVLQRARALYQKKVSQGAVKNPCYFAMDATRPNDLTDGRLGGRFYVICESGRSFRAISAGHGGGRDLKGVADFANGRRCARNFGNAMDSTLTTGGAYVTGETKTSFKGYYWRGRCPHSWREAASRSVGRDCYLLGGRSRDPRLWHQPRRHRSLPLVAPYQHRDQRSAVSDNVDDVVRAYRSRGHGSKTRSLELDSKTSRKSVAVAIVFAEVFQVGERLGRCPPSRFEWHSTLGYPDYRFETSNTTELPCIVAPFRVLTYPTGWLLREPALAHAPNDHRDDNHVRSSSAGASPREARSNA